MTIFKLQKNFVRGNWRGGRRVWGLAGVFFGWLDRAPIFRGKLDVSAIRPPRPRGKWSQNQAVVTKLRRKPACDR